MIRNTQMRITLADLTRNKKRKKRITLATIKYSRNVFHMYIEFNSTNEIDILVYV